MSKLLKSKDSRAAFARMIRGWTTARIKKLLRAAPVVNPELVRLRNGLLYAELEHRRGHAPVAAKVPKSPRIKPAPVPARELQDRFTKKALLDEIRESRRMRPQRYNR